MDPEHLGSIIRPADVDELFQRLGARRQALDPLHKIAPMSHHGKIWLSCTGPYHYASSDFLPRNNYGYQAEESCPVDFGSQVVPRNRHHIFVGRLLLRVKGQDLHGL